AGYHPTPIPFDHKVAVWHDVHHRHGEAVCEHSVARQLSIAIELPVGTLRVELTGSVSGAEAEVGVRLRGLGQRSLILLIGDRRLGDCYREYVADVASTVVLKEICIARVTPLPE